MNDNNFGPNYNYTPTPQQPYPTKTNGKAIAALVLGILAIIIPYIGFILGIIAIILGALSLKEIAKASEQGRGLAIAGLVCGIIGTALYALLILILIIGFITFGAMESNSYYDAAVNLSTPFIKI